MATWLTQEVQYTGILFYHSDAPYRKASLYLESLALLFFQEQPTLDMAPSCFEQAPQFAR